MTGGKESIRKEEEEEEEAFLERRFRFIFPSL